MSESLLTLILVLFGTPQTIDLINSEVQTIQTEQQSSAPSTAPLRAPEGQPATGPDMEPQKESFRGPDRGWWNPLLPSIGKVGAPEWVNERVEYAYHVSGWSIEFVSTIEAENSEWTTDRLSNTSYVRKGKRWYDVGICQISQYYHPKVISDPRFGDWKWQIDQCWKMFKGGTKFYGNTNWKNTQKRFVIGQ